MGVAPTLLACYRRDASPPVKAENLDGSACTLPSLRDYFNRTARKFSVVFCCSSVIYVGWRRMRIEHCPLMFNRTGGRKQVVIPIQTIGFYNWSGWDFHPPLFGCHTHPNDRLLQHAVKALKQSAWRVVIPIQTIGFYNTPVPEEFDVVEVVIPIHTIGFYNGVRHRAL